MTDSILDTVKGVLGIPTDITDFDVALIVEINTALATLNQLGLGVEEGLVVVDADDEWDDFLDEVTNLEDAKSYICHKVRLAFDPPQHQFLVDAIQKQIEELGWRLMVKVDPETNPEEEEEEDE
jgi:hypothetical protein